MIKMKSDLNETMALFLKGTPEIPLFQREYLFAKEMGRRWRFDFAFPAKKVAIELQGGLFIPKGGHTSVKGFVKDCDKNNDAIRLGWKVFKFTRIHVRERAKEMIEMIKREL